MVTIIYILVVITSFQQLRSLAFFSCPSIRVTRLLLAFISELEKKKKNQQNESPLGCETRTIFTRRLNKGFCSKFSVVYPDRHTPDEGREAQRPKRGDNNTKAFRYLLDCI